MKRFSAALLVICPLATVAVWGQDRVDLEGTSIIGNRELPKVLYIVPWKEPDLGDLGELPPAGLLDEVLSPLDREVFQRQLDYYAFIEGAPPRASKPRK
jgi:hypothetical protein